MTVTVWRNDLGCPVELDGPAGGVAGALADRGGGGVGPGPAGGGHGSLASIPLHRVAGISADLAPQLDLNAGAARTALRKAVLAARNGDLR